MEKIISKKWLHILDFLAIFSWSLLLFKYWFTGQLNLLIHPNYFLLVLVTSIILFFVALGKIFLLIHDYRPQSQWSTTGNSQHHTKLLPVGWGSSLLLMVAILGLIINPKVLSSQIAMQRGITDSLPPTTLQAQSFLTTTPPEKRSLIEWVRTLNVYPEPDNYMGQPANINGFVVHLQQLPDNYIYLSRFVLTCCAVDAYPVGIVVKLPVSRSQYPADSWLEVQGMMQTEILPSLDPKSTKKEQRQLVLNASEVKTIPTPKNPYSY
jgi:uncharacterized repeat protein (TIGR03943 family)